MLKYFADFQFLHPSYLWVTMNDTKPSFIVTHNLNRRTFLSINKSWKYPNWKYQTTGGGGVQSSDVWKTCLLCTIKYQSTLLQFPKFCVETIGSLHYRLCKKTITDTPKRFHIKLTHSFFSPIIIAKISARAYVRYAGYEK